MNESAKPKKSIVDERFEYVGDRRSINGRRFAGDAGEPPSRAFVMDHGPQTTGT
jgi:hypothetical protein